MQKLELLRETILDCGFSIAEAASEIDAHRTTLYNHLNGHMKLSPEKGKALLDLLDCGLTLDDIYED